ncbi:conserved hypothetical protein [Shewanella sp. MR-4]|nr:conserved hypothetical protein [Shewanella sp. MR-4]
MKMKLMAAFLTAVCSFSASPISWACSYDGQFANPFSESYPGALDVAMATQQALNAKTISELSKLEGEEGLRRASGWLQLLADEYSAELKGAYIYIVDNQLWSKLDTNNKLVIHSQPPEINQKVFLLTEVSLHSIVSKRLSWQEAEKLGLVWKS